MRYTSIFFIYSVQKVAFASLELNATVYSDAISSHPTLKRPPSPYMPNHFFASIKKHSGQNWVLRRILATYSAKHRLTQKSEATCPTKYNQTGFVGHGQAPNITVPNYHGPKIDPVPTALYTYAGGGGRGRVVQYGHVCLFSESSAFYGMEVPTGKV